MKLTSREKSIAYSLVNIFMLLLCFVVLINVELGNSSFYSNLVLGLDIALIYALAPIFFVLKEKAANKRLYYFAYLIISIPIILLVISYIHNKKIDSLVLLVFYIGILSFAWITVIGFLGLLADALKIKISFKKIENKFFGAVLLFVISALYVIFLYLLIYAASQIYTEIILSAVLLSIVFVFSFFIYHSIHKLISGWNVLVFRSSIAFICILITCLSFVFLYIADLPLSLFKPDNWEWVYFCLYLICFNIVIALLIIADLVLISITKKTTKRKNHIQASPPIPLSTMQETAPNAEN